MIEQLSRNERQLSLVILLCLAVLGLSMAAVGRDDPLGAHGALVLLAAIGGLFFVISGYYAPEAGPERLHSYYDDPSKVGIVIAMAWAVIGLFVGDWVAWQLVNPDLTFDAPGRALGGSARCTPLPSFSGSAATP